VDFVTLMLNRLTIVACTLDRNNRDDWALTVEQHREKN
jgi:hypothetical protein